MTSSTLLADLVLPAITGLIIGFAAGLIVGAAATLRWISRRANRGADVPIYHDDPIDDASPADATERAPRKRPWRGREHFSKLGWVLATLGVVGFLAGVLSLVQNNSTAQCLSDFVANNAASSRERAVAADLDRQAIRQHRQITQEFNQIMINAVTHPVTDPAGQAKAREDFLVKAKDWDARLAEVDRLDQQAERQRQNNPLPARPTC